MLPVKDSIVKACKEHGLSKEQCAYVLATTYHETAKTMEPVKEAYWLGEGWRKENLRYYPWYGRGYVQITWKRNYVKAGEELGLDLTSDPDTVMKPEISTEILVRGMKGGWFTGKKLDDYINDNKKDYVNSRRIVNGTDKANDIALYAEMYEKQLDDYEGSNACLTETNGTWIKRFQSLLSLHWLYKR